MPLFGNKTQKPWSPQDEARLKRVRLLSRLLDEQFRIPGTTYRVGLDGLLGLIPGVGDAAGALLSTYILYEAMRLGAPSTVLLRMVANIGIDTVGGAIPVVGDIFDIAWKANKVVLLVQSRASGCLGNPCADSVTAIPLPAKAGGPLADFLWHKICSFSV